MAEIIAKINSKHNSFYGSILIMKRNLEQYNNLKSGLYIISTPIGNLDDISFRAVKILENLDLILAEDTRRTKQLLNILGIKYPKDGFISFNEKNEKQNLFKVLNAIDKFSIVGFVCDAGTPCISDPGITLINEFRKRSFSVIPVPGPSALTTAISLCGFKFDQKNPISFWSFLPAKKNNRLTFLQKIKSKAGIAVIFEAPHRIDASIADCLQIFGSKCEMFIGRELTKKFETLWWGNIGEYINIRTIKSISNSNELAGEYVLVFDLSSFGEKINNNHEIDQWINILQKYLKPSELATLLSKQFDMPKKIVYKKIINI